MNQHPATDEQGQTMAEYAVVLGVITFVIITTFLTLSGAINAFILNVIDGLTP